MQTVTVPANIQQVPGLQGNVAGPQNPYANYRTGTQINYPSPIVNPAAYTIPPPGPVYVQPAGYPNTVVNNPQQYIEYVNYPRPPAPDEPEDRTGFLDRVYDAAQSVRGFANRVIDGTGDYVGDRVGGAYQYAGDVGEYAYKRQRVILNSANSPQMQGQMSEMDESSKLSTGALIGIIAGGVCFLGLCIASICYFAMGNKRGANGPHES